MRIAFLSLMLFSIPLLATDADALLGEWLTDEGDVIEIYKEGETYDGKIKDIVEKLYEPGHEMAGKPKVDLENPDASMRDTPIIGLVIMRGFSWSVKKSTWQGGTIYDPNNGKTYKCKIQLDGNKLKVRGYIGIPTLGRTAVWTRK